MSASGLFVETFPAVLDHDVLARLRSERRSRVYRARDSRTGELVILKTISDDAASAETVARLKRELDVTARLGGAVEGVIHARGLVWAGDRCFLELEDIGGESLDRITAARGLGLVEGLRIMARVARILDGVHAMNTVHKDITPANIVVNLHDDALRLIDFGSASELSRETPQFCEPDLIEGTLAYISPEQTGRMNRTLDYRSDYYSLGATFYEVLTRHPPFDFTDPIELLHAHIALTPRAPRLVDPNIPEAVSQVLMKLLTKSADDRYQSAAGLIADIEECIAAIEAGRPQDRFVPGRHDSPGRFRIAQKLYGRAAEIAMLMNAFARTSRGAAELVLVRGYSGIGKSSLVHEVHKPVTQRRGSYIAGKFDQLQRNIPYSAILRALTDLVEARLTEPEESLARWRSEVALAVGELGRVIVEFLPIAELLTGATEPVPALGPAEAERRFLQVFKRFLQVFCRESHPLVLFMDDLQWADSASLKLLEALLESRDLHHLLLIGAYRDNEVDGSHPLRRTLRTLEQSGATTTTIALDCLADADITELLVDTLGCTTAAAAPLAALLLEKTRGNAFFLTQFLRSLHDDGLLHCERKQAGGDGDDGERAWVWAWDIEAIRQRAITDNVVELMARKIARLPAGEQRVLKLAACLGNSFNLQKLAIVCELDERRLMTVVRPILEEGLLLPLDEHYKLVATAARAADADPASASEPVPQICAFRFLHDRVQEASYSLVEVAERPETHLMIGRLLLRSTSEDQIQERLFEIVSQLDAGLALVDDPAEATTIARLSLQAGRKAKAAMAYSMAIKMLQSGSEVLAPWNPWVDRFDLVFDLQNELALCEYVTGRFEDSDRRFRGLCERARTPTQVGKVYGEAVYLHTTMNEYLVAIDLAREGLSRLGYEFPRELTMEILGAEFARAEATLAGRRIADLLALPEATDPEIVAPFAILNMAIPPCWLALPPGFAWTTLQMVNLSQQHGNTRTSPFGYGIYALLLCGAPEKYQQGLEYGELAIALNQRFPDVFVKGTVHFFFSSFVQHWTRPKRLNLPLHEIAQRCCAESGAYVYGVYSVIFFFFQSFYSDLALDRVRELYEGQIPFVEQVGDQDVLGVLRLLRQLTQNLMDRTAPEAALDDPQFDERAYVAQLEARGYGNGLSYYHFAKLVACFYVERFDDALAHAERLLPYYGYMPGLYHCLLFHFYRALAITAVLPGASGERAQVLGQQLRDDHAFLARHAAQCPENFAAQHALVAAEQARVEGRADALRLYHRAIELARADDCVPGRALAEELAAKYCAAQGLPEYATAHMLRCAAEYGTWGALRKLDLLRTRYPRSFHPTGPALGRGFLAGRAAPLGEGEGAAFWPSTIKRMEIDVASLLKASHAIAREVDIAELMRKVLRVAVEHAGAHRGALLLARDEALFVEAEFGAAEDQPTIDPHPLTASERVPKTVIYLAYRTGADVYVPNVADDPRFAADPYFRAHHARAVLCSPMVLQGQPTGVLYLENDIEGALTKRSLEVVGLLATQAAISLRNALYIARLERASADLERRNEELELERKVVATLSLPILEVGHGILAVPLIGRLDLARMDRISLSLLSEVARRQPRAVVVDTTGLDAVDEATVQHLIDLGRMLRLLGSRLVLTGISGALAMAMVALDVGISGVDTYSTVKEALARLATRPR